MKNFKSIFSKGKKTKKHPSSETEIAKDSPGVDPTDSHKKYSNTLPQEVIEELKASKGGKTLPRRPTQPPVPNSRSGFVDMKTGSDFKRQSFSSVKETPAQAVETMPPKQAVEFAEVKGLQSLGCVDVSACDEFAESPAAARAYDAVPILEQTKLPRGGISVDTKAVGRVQYGIPPETIKDSMKLGIPVPQVYIVPTERFSREMGPALGVNLAEFEFPAYFNFFVYKKKCTLVVDSGDAEENIRKVFSETLLGPEQFRRENFISYEEEDFASDFPKDAIPDFQKELKHFRIMPDGQELVIETLLNFRHYEFVEAAESLGVPKPIPGDDDLKIDDLKINEVSDENQVQTFTSDLREVAKRADHSTWSYSEAISNGDVSRVYPFSATPEEIAVGKVPRVEVFKMPGGTGYIIHDIDENNEIIGKAKLSGHVKVSEFMSVDGFGGKSFLDAMDPSNDDAQVASPGRPLKAPSFHPPSFGVTVLGNSHGFDKSGSVSGYVLWINGRGVMIDPPPYSSATLEREGIRSRTIVGIILTHCHADHDAGAFQKVLTGSPVVVITTPTIYKSFIRKYSALSALSPALLRHSHRYKPAIIGQPLRFQGATFHFTYTLHTIPCIGFRVEWRGRSMVFTGDHFNNPAGLEKLVEKGVMSKARMDDLNHLPLQDCDILLHESGAPPIHTPLEVLLQLPKHVKERLFVVHTSALPDDCELRVAPTGTAGTIRLDKTSSHDRKGVPRVDDEKIWGGSSSEYSTIAEESETDLDQSLGQGSSHSFSTGRGGRGKATQRTSVFNRGGRAPLVSLRPASSTDAWYILNLLSAVPFLSSLSYTQTMEVLEIARVDAYSMSDVVVSATNRSSVLCVIWEGTCAELPAKRAAESSASTFSGDYLEYDLGFGPFWHAGDWMAPRVLQPEEALSGESPTSSSHDIVAMSNEGVKVIKIDFPSLHAILNSGSELYRRFLERNAGQERAKMDTALDDEFASATDLLLDTAKKELNVLDLLNCNSALRKLAAVQKRHLESLAVGPICYQQGERLWGAGTPVDKAFIIVSGTASFVKRRNASTTEGSSFGLKVDMETAIKELGGKHHGDENSSMSSDHDEQIPKVGVDTMPNADYKKLQKNLQSRAEYFQKEGSVSSGLSGYSGDSVSHDGDYDSDENFDDSNHRRGSTMRRRSSRMRQANKVLGRLYNRRAFTAGLVFSKGHFLGDVSKMVAGLLSSDAFAEADSGDYGFGEKDESSAADARALATITEASGAGSYHVLHNSTLIAGKDGCVVLLFHKASLIPFLDEHPGLLLSLLGTQVVV